LTDADEFVFKYMEEHKAQFPKSNTVRILQTLKANKANKDSFSFPSPKPPIEQFADAVVAATKLTKHEAICLARFYSEKDEKIVAVEKFVRDLS
jgi:hypothetical protein